MNTLLHPSSTQVFSKLAPWGLAVLMLVGLGCDQSSSSSLPTSRPEMDQQVKRLREDTEIELRDLRGRWLAVEGMLTQQRDRLAQDHKSQNSLVQRVDERLAQMEVRLGALEADIDALKRITRAPSEMNDVLERLARSYEEIPPQVWSGLTVTGSHPPLTTSNLRPLTSPGKAPEKSARSPAAPCSGTGRPPG